MKTPSTEPFYSGIKWNEAPQFKNVAEYDFDIPYSSPAVNSGLNISIPQDIKGRARDAQPDMGAYEFQ
jgi:hypothetical protein